MSNDISNDAVDNTDQETEPLIDIPLNNTRTSSATRDSLLSIGNENIPQDQDVHLRARLRFYFMSPCWKWHMKRQCPWKAWFQVLKIIIVTTQLILFGIDRQANVVFISESNITFHHLFLRDWDATDEILPYPRATGDFAVYTNQDFMDSINYAVSQFNELTNLSLGLFDYQNPSAASKSDLTGNAINLCLNRFKLCHTDPASHTYELNIQIENVCFIFNATKDFDVQEYLLRTHNETINNCGLNFLTLEFAIHAIQLKSQKPFNLPDCYHFIVKITFDNSDRTGKVRLYLDARAQFRTCNRKIHDENSGWTLVRRDLSIVLDFVVLLITSTSFTLCLRSIWSGHKLCRQVRLYYSQSRRNEPPLEWSELRIFYSVWYFLMIATDLLIIPGTILKIQILFKVTDNYNATGLLLGISSLFSWIGILRYFTFFQKYNLLFLTVQKALPLLYRFLICAMIIYFGFMFCGWIVLGPYHSKFASLSSTSDALFSLINGDDMYATFSNLETESLYVWLFSQIYLLSFISFFIYVVLNLSITLIIDGYETVKEYYANGYPKSRLQKFSEENVPQWSGREDWQDLSRAIEAKAVCFPCCFKTSREVSTMVARDTYVTQDSFAID